LMSSLVEGLVNLGDQVTVISSFPHYKRNQLPKKYRWKLFETETLSKNYRIIRTWVYVPPSQRLILRALNYLSFMLCSLLAGLFHGPYDHVVIYSPPPSNGIAGLIVSRLCRASMIYNVQDIYPDIGIRLGIFKNKWLIKLSQNLENFFYAASHAIVVISQGFKSNLLAKGVPENKIHIIHNWIDTQLIRPLPLDNSFRNARGWDDCFIVLYAGNIGLSQNMDDLLMVAKCDTLPSNIRFVVVGEGSGRKEFEEKARRLGLNNVEVFDFFPQNEVPLLLASANVSLVLLKQEVTNESLPSKVLSIMSSGRPMIGVVAENSDTWNLISDRKAGLCVRPGDINDFLASIQFFYHHRESGDEMGSNGREWVVNNCDRVVAATKYHDLFNALA
jgi:colanic acid biosynthesis glycosyl transferase WcaI